VADALDQAVVGTDLEAATTTPAWVRAFAAVQMALVLTAVVGLGWIATLLALELSGSSAPDPPRVAGLSLPLLLLLGGVLIGAALSAASSALARVSAAGAAHTVDRDLRAAVAGVSESLVVRPMDEALAAHEQARSALARVLKS